MHSLQIEQTASTPQVSYHPAEKKLKVWGESYPENSFEFYAPISEKVKQSLAAGDSFHLEVNVSYMNSSSTKCMLDLLDLLEEGHGRGVEVSVTWHYDGDNPRSFDLAQEFKEEVTLPFHIVEFTG